jgi:hypothetical protein
MSDKICSYCGTSTGEINFDIFTENYYCESEECIRKAQKDTKEYFKERERKISKDFTITDVTSQEDFENILYSMFGMLDRAGKTKELGALAEPDFFKNKAMYLIASELPEGYVKIDMGEKDRTKVKITVLKNIPAHILKEAMKKAKFLD